MQDDLRALPSVERLLQTEPLRSAAEQGPRGLAVEAARRALEQCREAILAGNGGPAGLEEIAVRAAHAMQESGRMSLGPVINATGVVIHTNLGRAPLAFEALEAIDSAASGYSNLEYDLEAGTRGSRQAHVEPLVRELTGAAAAMAVNNNAAAVLLALAATAHGREVVISRGQLVEIGGSFRTHNSASCTAFTNSIYLIYKDYTRSIFFCLLKQVTNPSSSNTNKHLNKTRTRNREKWNICFACNSFS